MQKTDLPAPPLFTVSSDHPKAGPHAINAKDALDAARVYFMMYLSHLEDLEAMQIKVKGRLWDREKLFQAFRDDGFEHGYQIYSHWSNDH